MINLFIYLFKKRKCIPGDTPTRVILRLYFLYCVEQLTIKLGIKPRLHILKISIFFTKSCSCQTYLHYEQPPQSLQNLYFQKPTESAYEEYLTRILIFLNKFRENFDFQSTLFSKNVPNFCRLCS